MRILNLLSGKGLFGALGLATLALLPLAHAGAPAKRGPVNLELEEGELGKIPTGWFQPKPSADAGYKAQLTDEHPRGGKRCAVLSREAKSEAKGAGILMQSFDATAYRGKRVRLRAAVRAEASGSANQAQLWLRVDRKANRPGFFDNRENIAQKEWREFEIVGEVAEDAASVHLGLVLVGNGRAWLDAVSFEILGKVGEGDEPARPLGGRGLDNLVAFTRLLGYVRYFHPSDEAAATNWETFAIEGVTAVEHAKGPAELARALEKLFRPIAPTVRVFPTGQPPAGDAGATPPGAAPGGKVIAWYHYGVGTGSPMSNYSSKRLDSEEMARRLQSAKVPDLKLPDPGKPFVADLGGGVSCRVPLALHADEKGTLPRAAAPARAVASSKPQGFVPSGKDRSTRLAAVALAWNVFQHFYPYFDVVKADWPGELRRALTRAATDADERAFLDTLRRLVAGLQDGHGHVSWDRDAPMSYPPLRWDWVEDRLVVTQVAAKGADGLKPGDVVLKVNGRPAAEALADQERLISGATPQWKRYHSLSALAAGAADSELTLEVLPRPGQARTVRLRRTLDWAGFHDLKEPRPAKVAEIRPGVMYVDIDRITDKDFQEALPRLEKARGIVFDLRGYPRVSPATIGHLIDRPVTTARWQIPITLHPDRRHVAFQFSNWQVAPRKPRFTAKVAFVTDGQAISYAETYLGIIEHYRLADIVGSATAGTNGNINPFTLPGRYRVIWTGMRVLRHDGTRHHGVGIRPTVPVERTIQGVTQGRDEALERAVSVVSPR